MLTPLLLNMLIQCDCEALALSNNILAFSVHKNIAYRFLSPSKIAAAIDIMVTLEPCVFTWIFLIFWGLNDDEVGIFAAAGEKEANAHNWQEVVGWSELAKDNEQFCVGQRYCKANRMI